MIADTVPNVVLHRWNAIPAEPLKEGLTRKLVTGERMMMAHVYLKKGVDVPRHSHENEQLTYILRARCNSGSARTMSKNSSCARVRRSSFPRICRTALWRSRTRSTSTCSVRPAGTGSTAPTRT